MTPKMTYYTYIYIYIFLTCLSVEEVKTRALSLRTQYSRLKKPKPRGSGTKPLTSKQRWLLRVMDFIKAHIVHRPCETNVSTNKNVVWCTLSVVFVLLWGSNI